MTNEQKITDLKNMAGQALRTWGVEDDSAKESAHAQAYAQICTAIAALNAANEKPFIQIGSDIIRKSDIVKLEIKEANSLYGYKHLYLYTRNISDNGEGYGSSSEHTVYKYDSSEAQALLTWLAGQSEILDLRLCEEGNADPAQGGHEFCDPFCGCDD